MFGLVLWTHLPWSTCSIYFASINQTKDGSCFKIDVLFSHKRWNCIYIYTHNSHSLQNIWVVSEQRGVKYWIVLSKIFFWNSQNERTSTTYFKIDFAYVQYNSQPMPPSFREPQAQFRRPHFLQISQLFFFPSFMLGVSSFLWGAITWRSNVLSRVQNSKTFRNARLKSSCSLGEVFQVLQTLICVIACFRWSLWKRRNCPPHSCNKIIINGLGLTLQNTQSI